MGNKLTTNKYIKHYICVSIKSKEKAIETRLISKVKYYISGF